MNPFRITCTTCRARLKIVDPAAVGQILACPKCNSMVQAVPPDGWNPDGPATPDSIVLGSSVTVRAIVPASGAKNSPTIAGTTAPAAAAGRGLPPPLPSVVPRVKPGAASAPQASATRVAPPVQTGIRWFWPVFGSATFVSLAVAALVIYLQHKDRADLVVADVPPRTHQSPDKPAAPTNANPAPATTAEPNPIAPANSVAGDSSAKPPTHKSAPEPTAAKPVAEPAPAKVVTEPAPAKASAKPQATDADHSTADKPGVVATKPRADNAAPAKQDETADHHADKPVIDATAKPNAKPAPADVAMPNGPAARPVRPSVEKVPPKAVDVETHLTDPVAGVNYRAVPLARLLDELSLLSTIPISLDADALAELNVPPDAPVTLRTKETTVSGLLDEALAPLALSYSVVGHQLVISRPAQGELRRVRYAVSDLAGETAESNAAFKSLVEAVIDPAAWKEAGGKATGQWIEGALVVTAGESTHAQLLVFCEKLRVARRLPLRSKIDPARFRLESRTSAAAAMLADPVTANYGRPESLARILSYLRGTTHFTLLVDHAALAEQRTSIDMEGTLAADHQPLGQSLTALLEPMELTWRVVGPRAIEVTTPQAAARHGEVEYYPAAELAAGGAEALVARISRELAAGADADPQGPRPVIRFDAPSRALVVRAPQSMQLRVAALLNEWRLAKK